MAPLAHAGRLLKAPLLAASRCLSSAAGGTLYDTLGVERNQHDAAQLKAAFRQRARLVHPDVQQAGADAAAFVRLVHAYETLSCPKRRALYDATLGDDSTLGGRSWRAKASAAAAAGDPNAEEQREDELGRGGRAGAVVRNPRRELNDALARAFHGPAVDLGAAAQGVLPLFFEGEERTELLHEDLMQLCSGRTLLGVVRHVVLKAFEAGGGAPQLFAVDGAEPPATTTARLDELRLLSHTGRLVASAHRRPRALHDSARPGSPWLEGGAGEGLIEVWLHEGDKAQLHCCVSAAGGGFGYGAIKDATGTTICSVFLHSTPFVTHLHFYAMNGAMQTCERLFGVPFFFAVPPLNCEHTMSAGKLRCRAVRAWLPPSAFWLFPPREESHASGGWSFEFVDLLDVPEVHCAVPVLVAALHTLDKERGQRAGVMGSMRGAFAWIRARVS